MQSRFRKRPGATPERRPPTPPRRETPPAPRTALDRIRAEYNQTQRQRGPSRAAPQRRLGLLRNHASSDALDTTEQKMLDHEMAIARDLQANILPKRLPMLPGYQINAYYRPSRDVGGDYYDFIEVDPEHLGLVVADVSGKGIPGSMVVQETRVLLRTLGPGILSPKEALTRVNHHLYQDIIRGMFVTVFYAILDVVDRSMALSSAGHNPMICYRAARNACTLVNPNGLALGIDKGPLFARTVQERRLRLEPGDIALLYTDGVTEAFNSKDEQYGPERLYAFIRDHHTLPVRELVKQLVADIDLHQGDAPQHDDITLVALRAEALGPEAPPAAEPPPAAPPEPVADHGGP